MFKSYFSGVGWAQQVVMFKVCCTFKILKTGMLNMWYYTIMLQKGLNIFWHENTRRKKFAISCTGSFLPHCQDILYNFPKSCFNYGYCVTEASCLGFTRKSLRSIRDQIKFYDHKARRVKLDLITWPFVMISLKKSIKELKNESLRVCIIRHKS